MKVCMFVRNDVTKDSRVRKEAEVLAQMGHKVVVFGLPGGHAPDIEEVNGFQIRRINSKYLKLIQRAWGLFLRLQQMISGEPQARPERAQKVSDSSKGRLGSREEAERNWIFRPTLWLIDPHFCRRTLREAINEKADVYHAHDLTTLHMAARAARLTGAKLVYDSHELYLERNPAYTDFNPVANFRLRRREKRLIRRADAVITVNGSIAAELAGRYAITMPHVIMNIPPLQSALDPTLLRQRLRSELGVTLQPDQKILLYLGGLTRHHGLEQVIESLKHLPNAVFVMMGYGYFGNYLENLMAGVRKGGLAGRVFLLRPVPTADVSRYSSGADVGLVPIQNVCKSYYYCSPNKIFECIAAHVPVAASDFPELRRIVTEHDIGELFDESDPLDIARAVKQIIDDPQRHAALKANTEKAAKILSWEREAEKLRQIYADLEAKRPPTAG